MQRLATRILGIAAALAAVAVLGWALVPRPITVEATRVGAGRLDATVVAEGRTRVKDLYVVTSPVDGELERIALQPGDSVRAGATVADLRPTVSRPLDSRSRAEATAAARGARAAVARAKATLEEAETARTHADSELETTRKLVTNSVAAPKTLEHAGHEADIRREAVVAASAALEASRADLARAEALVAPTEQRAGHSVVLVPSPVAGRILRVLHESAGPVVAGTPLIEIADSSAIEVTADLLTADAMRVRIGAAAVIREWGGDRPVAARVRRVDPAAFTKVSALGLEEQRVRVVLDLVEPSPSGLGHDFRVSVAIVVWTGERVLTIPSTALFRSGDRWAVFVVENQRARLRTVETGPADERRTSIVRGLVAGDQVILQPSDQLSDGSRVRIAGE